MSKKAICIDHIRCPKCNSRDNVGLYDDGSEWCFGCGYYKPPAGMARILSVVRPSERSSKYKDVVLPDDVTYSIQPNHLEWLRKYGITTPEIVKYRIMSSPTQGLVLPIYDTSGEELIFYTNRPMMEGKPKSIDHGPKPLVLFGNKECKNHDVVVVVEDYISALKVSRDYFCVPLFGSFMSTETLLKLRRRFKTVVYWLDPDKYLVSVRMMMRTSTLIQSHVIKADKDPKDYTSAQVVSYVEECLK